MLMVDVSGSMDASTGTGNNSCGQTHNRINDARCAIQRVVNAFGDVQFGLGKFTQGCSNCDWNGNGYSCSGCDYDGSGAGCPATGADETRGDILVGIVDDNQQQILNWVTSPAAATASARGRARS